VNEISPEAVLVTELLPSIFLPNGTAAAGEPFVGNSAEVLIAFFQAEADNLALCRACTLGLRAMSSRREYET